MAGLTTHVLDTALGAPGEGIRVSLSRIDGSARQALKQAVTNADGRCDEPLIDADSLEAGTYELVFAVGDYYRTRGVTLAEPAFLDDVVLRFGIAHTDQHYHVPLLVSPYSYSTYRGS